MITDLQNLAATLTEKSDAYYKAAKRAETSYLVNEYSSKALAMGEAVVEVYNLIFKLQNPN